MASAPELLTAEVGEMLSWEELVAACTELLFVELIPYRASVHDGDPAHPAQQWRPQG